MDNHMSNKRSHAQIPKELITNNKERLNIEYDIRYLAVYIRYDEESNKIYVDMYRNSMYQESVLLSPGDTCDINHEVKFDLVKTINMADMFPIKIQYKDQTKYLTLNEDNELCLK